MSVLKKWVFKLQMHKCSNLPRKFIYLYIFLQIFFLLPLNFEKEIKVISFMRNPSTPSNPKCQRARSGHRGSLKVAFLLQILYSLAISSTQRAVIVLAFLGGKFVDSHLHLTELSNKFQCTALKKIFFWNLRKNCEYRTKIFFLNH